MTINNIAIRSFQSELSHLSALPLLIYGKTITKIFFAIISIYHIIRYIKYFDIALTISKKQLNKLQYNIIDYVIIILYQFELYKIKSIILLFTFSILSGILSFYFIYLEYGKKKDFSNNIYIDIFMVCSLIILCLYEKDNRIRFFCIRDIIYHICEFMFYY